MDIVEELSNLLSNVAENQNWKNYEIKTNTDKEKANGFLGDFFIGSVTNKDTKEILNLAIKKAFKNKGKRELLSIRMVYLNEIYFYMDIKPTLENFLRERKITQPLEYLGKCYLTMDDESCESIVMENLKTLGYDILGREALLEDKHVRYAFYTYGQFHGISFAYKDQHPEEYKKIVANLGDFLKNMADSEEYHKFLNDLTTNVLSFIDDDLKIQVKSFFENIANENIELCSYNGKYSCILHGDCWSNNVMFKQTDKLEGIKLVDFQLIREGSPVQDLSYFFYAGSSNELYENLDEYLQIYHKSLSNTITQLGSDPNELFPFEALVEDWKKYSKFGMVMAINILKIKLFSTKDVEELANENNNMDGYKNIKVDTSIWEERVRNMLQHFCDRKFM